MTSMKKPKLEIKLLKAALLAAVFIALCGCMMSSTAVSGIGVRTIYGETTVTNQEEGIFIDLIDTSLTSNGWAMMHGIAIPYSSLQREKGGNFIGKVSLRLSDIEWLKSEGGIKIGQYKCKVDGVERDFEARLKSFESKRTELFLESKYRRWYGYPAQGLLVVSLPIDIATDAVLAGGFLVVAPIYYGVELIKGTSNQGDTPAQKPAR